MKRLFEQAYYSRILHSTFALSLMLSGCGASDSTEEDGAEAETATSSSSTTTTSTASTSSTSSTTSTEAAPTTVSLDQPSNSTGTKVDTTIRLGSTSSSGLYLAAGSIIVNDQTIVTVAKLSIGGIKVKVDKSESTHEGELKKAMKARKEKLKESMKESEKTVEKKIEEQKKKFEEQKKELKDESEIKALEKSWEATKKTIEAEKADLFKAKESELDDLEASADPNLHWKGPFIYDAVAQTVTPELTTISLKDGSYRRLELKLKPNRSDKSENSMVNLSALIVGTYKTIPFEIRYTKDDEYKLMGSGTIDLESGVANTMQVSFDIATAMRSVDFAKAKVDETTGSIVIDKDNNSDLLESIFKALKKGTAFGKDQNGDGRLESSEKKGDGIEGSAESN